MLEPGEEIHDLATLVRVKAQKNGRRPALRFLTGELQYDELDRLSDRVATGLRRAGLAKGDRVACFLGNRAEFPVLLFAAAKLGAVLVPLNTGLTGELLRYELRDSEPRATVLDATGLQRWRELGLGQEGPNLWSVDSGSGDEEGPRVPSFSELLEDSDDPPTGAPDPWDPAEIVYTSGTTGRPKGAVLPHERLINTPREIGRCARLGPDSVLFTALPLFHCNALEKTTLVALLNDRVACFADRFHPSAFWPTAQRFGATHVSLLATMITLLLKQPLGPADRAHSVRIATASGTPVAVWREFEERFGLTLVESYGMTECGCTTLMNPPEAVRRGSVGLPLSFVEAALVDDEDRPVAPPTPGELVVRPRAPFTMFLEYFRDPEQTIRSWRNLWFHTGDLLRQDEEGFFYFLDRKRDVIRRRGENVAPFNVEDVLHQHPAVLECVVVGVPAELGEEDIKACVVLRPGARAAPEDLFRFTAARLPFFMVPRYIEFVESIPKTANQKAQRSAFRGKLTGREADLESIRRTTPTTGDSPGAAPDRMDPAQIG
jgi:crotonobetaine/carnitine-CoA ligase